LPQTLARLVVERDESLRGRRVPAAHVVADALVAAGVAVFVAQPADQLGDRVLLLGRRRLVTAEDGIDDRLEGINHGRHGPAPVRLGLGLSEDLADLAARMVKAPRQLVDAHLVDAMGAANACVLVHLDHPPPPVVWHQLRSW
jgi:hypothetical protein